MKQIAIKLDEATHKAAKIRAVMQDKSFMQYVIDLIKKDLATKNEQTRWLWRDTWLLNRETR